MPGCGGGKAGTAGIGKDRNRFSANVFSLFKIMYWSLRTKINWKVVRGYEQVLPPKRLRKCTHEIKNAYIK